MGDAAYDSTDEACDELSRSVGQNAPSGSACPSDSAPNAEGRARYAAPAAAEALVKRHQLTRDGRKGWDDDESDRILEGAKAGGWSEGMQRGDWNANWTEISDVVKTRNPKQCRERWENFADPVRAPCCATSALALTAAHEQAVVLRAGHRPQPAIT